MKTRTEIELRQSEIRESLNAADEPDNATELRTELRALEGDYRTAIKAEQEAEKRAQAQREGDPNAADDGEGVEFRALVERVEVRNYLTAAINDKTISEGAEHELAQAVELEAREGGVILPWEVLAPVEVRQVEDRAVTPAPGQVGENQQGVIGRVFARTGAAHVGVRFPTVGVGKPVFVYVSGGNDPAFEDNAAAADETAGAFSTKVFSPKRLTASYRMQREDLAVLAGMESALRGDLRSALGEVLDKQIIGAGDGQVRGLLATAANGGLADVVNPAVVTVALMETEFLTPIDGKHATREEEIRYLIGADTYRTLYGLEQSGVRPFNPFKPRAQVSAHIPAKAANIQQGIAVTTRGPVLVAPVWQGVEIIRDPYTAAGKGEIVLTGIMLANFGIVRDDGATRLKFKLA